MLEPPLLLLLLRLQLEMVVRLRAGQRDGRRRQANDFGGWVKTMVLFFAVSGPKFRKF